MTPGRFKKQHPPVGARPGTLAISPEAAPCKVQLVAYSRDTVDEMAVESLDDLDRATGENMVHWIMIQGLGDQSLLRQMGERFALHPLLLEDVVNVPQRPKVELYGDKLLIVVRLVGTDARGDLEMEQLSLILAGNHVITFQERYSELFTPVLKRIRAGKGPIRRLGADYLAYAIADTVIDGYYPVLEVVGDQLETLESDVLDRPEPDVLRRLHEMKLQLVNLRRGIWPQREAVSELFRGDYSQISDEVRIYLRDTYDHCIQTSEVVEMYREMITGLMNTYLSAVANRTNDVMKVLTIMASIFIPLTFLAGIYGMNFEHMPELQYKWAYAMVWIAMGAIAAGMFTYFWRKGWIGPERRSPSPGSPGSAK